MSSIVLHNESIRSLSRDRAKFEVLLSLSLSALLVAIAWIAITAVGGLEANYAPLALALAMLVTFATLAVLHANKTAPRLNRIYEKAEGLISNGSEDNGWSPVAMSPSELKKTALSAMYGKDPKIKLEDGRTLQFKSTADGVELTDL